ncbi:hypothetical protein DFH09DRAFT_949795 [Mycena vulgaris]|nr:hypothetical protein DFH09DRAFT_949795 [Mycena vulgaris]
MGSARGLLFTWTPFLRAAHLIPVYGDDPVPRHFKHTSSLDSFAAFYINK